MPTGQCNRGTDVRLPQMHNHRCTAPMEVSKALAVKTNRRAEGIRQPTPFHSIPTHSLNLRCFHPLPFRLVFFISAAVFAFGAIVFLVFASGDVQPFNDPVAKHSSANDSDDSGGGEEEEDGVVGVEARQRQGRHPIDESVPLLSSTQGTINR